MRMKKEIDKRKGLLSHIGENIYILIIKGEALKDNNNNKQRHKDQKQWIQKHK